jgi:hypothetical protein
MPPTSMRACAPAGDLTLREWPPTVMDSEEITALLAPPGASSSHLPMPFSKLSDTRDRTLEDALPL